MTVESEKKVYTMYKNGGIELQFAKMTVASASKM